MKQIVKLSLAILSVAVFYIDGAGQILGKIYQIGDTIILDGIPCLVYKVDETGLHGTAMSPYARSSKEIEKMKKKTLKHYEKEIKKGNATPEDMNDWLTNFSSQWQIPVITVEKVNGGRVYRVENWSKQIPHGWRIPSTKDAEEFATFYCGGVGRSYGIKYTFVNKANSLTTDPLLRSSLTQIAFYGMIVSDSYNPADVKFLQRLHSKGTGKSWFELEASFVGSEKTVAVKDF